MGDKAKMLHRILHRKKIFVTPTLSLEDLCCRLMLPVVKWPWSLFKCEMTVSKRKSIVFTPRVIHYWTIEPHSHKGKWSLNKKLGVAQVEMIKWQLHSLCAKRLQPQTEIMYILTHTHTYTEVWMRSRSCFIVFYQKPPKLQKFTIMKIWYGLHAGLTVLLNQGQ